MGASELEHTPENSERSYGMWSRARGPELFALARVVRLQVAPWMCVKCPRAALREGVALRKLPGRTSAG